MKNILSKILITFSFISMLGGLFIQRATAQPYSNSWIHYSNTYYKFRVTDAGIYRISKSQLDAIGMGSVSGNQFAIFREGQEVPLYTSATGTFGSSDFIEFYASRADGKVDVPLYPEAFFQPNEDVNLFSDTAYYFITFDNGVHQRMQAVSNAIPVPAPAAAPYCWSTVLASGNPKLSWNPGASHTNSDYFYSSDFDLGEGYAYANGINNTTYSIATPQAYASGPSSSYSFTWSELSLSAADTNASHLVVALNNSTVFDTSFIKTFRTIKRTLNIGTGLLSDVNTLSFNEPYQYFVQRLKIKYPRTYNFQGAFANKSDFEIPASDRYLEISNFNTGGSAPRLYDRTNNKIYSGTESGGVVKFYLDASLQQRSVYLTNTPSINNISAFSPIQFRDYSNAVNQGNYIILSHKDYINATPNNIDAYKSYRASTAGGSYQPVVVDVTELYNQFGYGNEFHPISIRNFVAYARDNWSVKPEFMFIIGKGISYTEFTAYQQSSGTYNYPIVPTWGEPGSDNLLTSFNNDQKPILATGRLSAWSNVEIGNYLKKVTDYEKEIKPLPKPTVEHEFWKKNVLHIAGSSNIALQTSLLSALNDCKTIIEDSLTGSIVTTIKKNSTDPVEQVNNAVIDSFMDHGLNHISFYGHGSSSGFDYNLNSPDNYHSSPRFPVFSAFACEVAHIFGLTTENSISEKYINSVNGGSIAMIAGNNTGWTGQLPRYMTDLYRSWSYRQYGKTLGQQYQKNIEFLQDDPGSLNDDMMDIHTQCLLYQGDPGLSVYNPEKVDYVIEEPGVSSIPTKVTTELDSFDVRVVVYSLGKSVRDSVWVRLQHTKPGMVNVMYADSIRIANLLSSDTLQFKVPLNPNTDIGLNNYTIKIDAGEQFDEISEDNNQANLQIFIFSENLVPVYPKEFAIVHEQGVTLKASTLNAFAPFKKYRLEIDTTENFNSSLKQATEISSMGGLIKWKPQISYQDSVVYYWRAAPDTLIQGAAPWSNSSFIYLANGSDGWNQSHYFQYKRDEPYSGLKLQPTTRRFQFDSLLNIFKVENKVISQVLGNFQDVRQSLNDFPFDNGGCLYHGSVQFVVIDSTSGQVWKNTMAGLYGTPPACGSNPLRQQFEFSTGDSVSRNNARLFINMVPPGCYIMIKNLIYGDVNYPYWDGQTIDNWKSDTLVYGPGNSLYHAIKNLGFDAIDQFTYKRVFAFFRKKGDANYPIEQAMSIGENDKITFTRIFYSYPDTGMVQSTVIGPALTWKSLKWSNSTNDNAPQNDSGYVVLSGIDTLNHEVVLYKGFSRDTSLSFIPAGQYPNIRLNWYSVDNITRTSPYLDYWRVLYDPVPEAALNAAAHFAFTDSLSEGQQGKLSVAIENLTPLPMDSMLVSFKIIDAGGVKHTLFDNRYKKLAGNDTLIASIDLDVSAYHGNNFIFIEANPNNDQPEQYHPNNLGYLSLFMQADKLNPLLDVTFDGIHILDKDIVSAKPAIKVLLRDENKFLALNDTALMKVKLRYPGQATDVEIPMDGTICRFFPAQIVNGKKNEARIEFKPTLPEDGLYKLTVSGKDKVGNVAGNTLNYEVNFTVENKPSITNVLNYPNPFSTATQFIFTMTGSEIPSQFKIQILSVTGKVVREIKKNELGDLHIGRNMTEYRWDGKDEFGQMLGNGVYLYRVVTSIRGESIEQRKNTTVDKFFKNGYGKLYIMR